MTWFVKAENCTNQVTIPVIRNKLVISISAFRIHLAGDRTRNILRCGFLHTTHDNVVLRTFNLQPGGTWLRVPRSTLLTLLLCNVVWVPEPNVLQQAGITTKIQKLEKHCAVMEKLVEDGKYPPSKQSEQSVKGCVVEGNQCTQSSNGSSSPPHQSTSLERKLKPNFLSALSSHRRQIQFSACSLIQSI